MVTGPDGRAVERRVGRVLEPVALLQPVDEAAVEIGDMADDALHLGVGDRLDGDVVAGPVDTDLADVAGVVVAARRRAQPARASGDGEAARRLSMRGIPRVELPTA